MCKSNVGFPLDDFGATFNTQSARPRYPVENISDPTSVGQVFRVLFRDKTKEFFHHVEGNASDLLLSSAAVYCRRIVVVSFMCMGIT